MPVEALLGDTVTRDYSRKLTLFNAFARPELRQAVASLGLTPGMRVVDAGCGTGDMLGVFLDEVKAAGVVVGMDLAAAHTTAARRANSPETAVLQANLSQPPLAAASFDLAWSVNTINHLRDPLAGVKALAGLLRAGGRVALGQSGFLPDMYFAWDSRLERLVTEAVRQYYRDRYQVDERDLTSIRALTGLLRRAGLGNVKVQTFVIERLSPLGAADEEYLLEAIFRGTWGERLRPYLAADDYEELTRLCDPQHPDYALRRSDFHFLQTFTLASGYV